MQIINIINRMDNNKVLLYCIVQGLHSISKINTVEKNIKKKNLCIYSVTYI